MESTVEYLSYHQEIFLTKCLTSAENWLETCLIKVSEMLLGLNSYWYKKTCT